MAGEITLEYCFSKQNFPAICMVCMHGSDSLHAWSLALSTLSRSRYILTFHVLRQIPQPIHC